jgi:hypothetical protein
MGSVYAVGHASASPILLPLLKPNADEDMHYAALGRFIRAYALAEAAVHVVARHFSRLSEKRSRIIFAGMRLKELAERVRALTQDQAQVNATVDSCLTQLRIIGDERHRLVHRQVDYEFKKGLSVTNRLTAKRLRETERSMLNLNQLEAMKQDCLAIFLQLSVTTGQIDLAPVREMSLLSAYASWRHKPQPQRHEKKADRNRTRPKSRARLPRASTK